MDTVDHFEHQLELYMEEADEVYGWVKNLEAACDSYRSDVEKLNYRVAMEYPRAEDAKKNLDELVAEMGVNGVDTLNALLEKTDSRAGVTRLVHSGGERPEVAEAFYRKYGELERFVQQYEELGLALIEVDRKTRELTGTSPDELIEERRASD